MKTNIKKLQELNKCGLYIKINEHKDYYQSTEDAIKYLIHNEELDYKIDKEIIENMLKHDCIVNIIAYTRTPVSIYDLYHYDIDEAIKIILTCIDKEN